ncbi:FAD/NAD(P)-binding protein [Rhodopirellula sp. JC639]|uniref:FAD/NAD(P)-binding protein n=1 Tax=Stieleria mannarensis TaxID=2755585 RepID=UPI001600CCD8
MSIANLPDATAPRGRDNGGGGRVRLAIVGCGPRGLRCLETLSRVIGERQLSAIDVTVFEPAGSPGAGHIYDPQQPHGLRMNYATQHIDFWRPTPQPSSAQSESLMRWLSDRYPDLAMTDQYIPRAIVGEYLSDCFREVSQRFPTASFRVIGERVRRVWRGPTGWNVEVNSGVSSFDLVVLATGHEGLRPSSALDHQPDSTQRKTQEIYPVESQLSNQRVGSGTTVLIRGMGLTAIDAVLSLTEGRGGEFLASDPLPRYSRCRDEPRRIDVRSRSGRPMLAKPTARVEPIEDDFWQPHRNRMEELRSRHGQLRFRSEIFSVVSEAAAGLLNQSCGNTFRGRDIFNWYRGWSRYRMDPSAAYDAMRQSYGVATGRLPKDIPYALGESWRRLYPQLVRLVSFGGLADDQYPSFRAVASEMERIAFGPPAESVGKLLALIHQDVVTLGQIDSQPQESENYDCVLDAVIAGPHDPSVFGPITGLLDDGTVRRHGPTHAIVTDQDGFVPGTDCTLAIFGRATEGWVVGNDTLSRGLHDQIDRWANRMAVLTDSPASDHHGI